MFFRPLCLLFLFVLSGLEAQDSKFTHYTVDNGLPSSQVHDIIQDKYGYLWFTTDGGLSRYDGYSFKNFTLQDGLTDNSLFKFYPEENGDIWCTTYNKSLFCISGNKPEFKPYKYNKLLTGLPDYFISNCIYWSKDRSLLMSVANVGYIQIDKNGKMTRHLSKPRESAHEVVFLPDKGNFYYLSSKAGSEKAAEIWPNCIRNKVSNGVVGARPCYFEKKKCTVFTSFNHLHIQRNHLGDTVRISTSFEPISLGKLNDTLFWVGFRYGGLSIFDLSGRVIRSYLNDKSVTSLCIDHQGGYWFSTLNDGIFHIANTSILYYRDINNWISSLTQDFSGNLWLGYYNGDVSVRCDGKNTYRYLSTYKRPALVEYYAPTKKIYFSSDYKIFDADITQPLYDPCGYITNFYVHRNDSILIASPSGIRMAHDQKQKKLAVEFRVNDICFYQNRIYLATTKGMYIIKDQGHQAVNNRLLMSLKISDIDPWSEKLLLATKGSGVLVMKDNKIQTIDVNDGLSSNLINEVHVENDSIFWVCTNSGLNRITFKNNKVCKITVISVSNGLLSNEVTDVEIIRDTAWVGTRRGLCSYPLALLQKKKTNINYHLTLNYFQVNDSLFAQNGPRELKYNQNRIEFGFKALSFIEAEPIVYRYKLAGYEKEWQYTKALSSTYASLPPGNYNFIVQVRGANALWECMQQDLRFTIHPPYWKTWWFVLTVMILMGIIIYLFFRFKIFSYNRDITRELLRQLLKRMTQKTNYVVFRENGKHIRIPSTAICYIKADGNYIEIHTHTRKYVIRFKIGEFLGIVPDPLEYLRISRSYIVRLDKIEEKGKKDVTIKGEKISVGETYLDQLKNIQF